MLVAIQNVVAGLLMRGPALAMQRVPLFVWGVLITNLLLLLHHLGVQDLCL